MDSFGLRVLFSTCKLFQHVYFIFYSDNFINHFASAENLFCNPSTQSKCNHKQIALFLLIVIRIIIQKNLNFRRAKTKFNFFHIECSISSVQPILCDTVVVSIWGIRHVTRVNLGRSTFFLNGELNLQLLSSFTRQRPNVVESSGSNGLRWLVHFRNSEVRRFLSPELNV